MNQIAATTLQQSPYLDKNNVKTILEQLAYAFPRRSVGTRKNSNSIKFRIPASYQLQETRRLEHE